jgi:enediyne biosynthesis protein E3
MAGIVQTLLSISPTEATFARRKFHFLRDSARQRLERVGETFLRGYNLALADQGIASLTERLNEIDTEFRGYGFEGAAMGLDLLDQIQPWKARRIDNLLRDSGKPHVYMVHVGVGWSMARWRLGMTRRLAHLNPVLQWLALDGFGFHEGYFHWPRYAVGTLPHFSKLRGYGLRAFDQGLGRSLWFVGGVDPEYITSEILRFPKFRRNDLWSGIGLACTYTGGADSGDVRELRRASGAHWPHIAQGAVFAAGARHRAGNMALQTELGCQLLCGLSAQQAADLCEETLRNVSSVSGNSEPGYEQWRRLIRTHIQLNEGLSENLPVNCGRSVPPQVAQRRVALSSRKEA